jgi:hypothetical protein
VVDLVDLDQETLEVMVDLVVEEQKATQVDLVTLPLLLLLKELMVEITLVIQVKQIQMQVQVVVVMVM